MLFGVTTATTENCFFLDTLRGGAGIVSNMKDAEVDAAVNALMAAAVAVVFVLAEVFLVVTNGSSEGVITVSFLERRLRVGFSIVYYPTSRKGFKPVRPFNL